MVFSTIIFLCAFLPVTIIGYYLMPGRGKNVFLLLCSLFFYGWGEPSYVFVMILSILCNYGFGMGIFRWPDKDKLWLTAAVLVNLGILCVFKYTGFIMANLCRFLPGVLKIPEIALPIGISFYTFQGLSYCIDVYRDKKIVQKNPLNLALYISMFPQLIAGPIVRYQDVSGFLAKRTHSAELFAIGAQRFIIGMAKKAVLANSMGALADQIMKSDVNYMSASVAWLGAIAYTLQIYFDFSGYSDMAIGLGKIFGFHFPENFNYPYISRSVREFWRRWHISLSTWFKDYLYIPMGGNRKGNVYLHLFIVFLATGLWHGAAWGFILWGLWHGMFCILERLAGKLVKKKGGKTGEPEEQGHTEEYGRGEENPWIEISRKSITGVKSLAGCFYTMLVVITGWVLFNLVSVRETLAYLKVMFGLTRNAFTAYDVFYFADGKTTILLFAATAACIPWKRVFKSAGVYTDLKEKAKSPLVKGENLVWIFMKRIILLLLLALCFVFIITSTYNPFIYFRF